MTVRCNSAHANREIVSAMSDETNTLFSTSQRMAGLYAMNKDELKNSTPIQLRKNENPAIRATESAIS